MSTLKCIVEARVCSMIIESLERHPDEKPSFSLDFDLKDPMGKTNEFNIILDEGELKKLSLAVNAVLKVN